MEESELGVLSPKCKVIPQLQTHKDGWGVREGTQLLGNETCMHDHGVLHCDCVFALDETLGYVSISQPKLQGDAWPWGVLFMRLYPRKF